MLERTESRGLHRRTDFPHGNSEFAGQHLISGSLDEMWVHKAPHMLGEMLRAA